VLEHTNDNFEPIFLKANIWERELLRLEGEIVNTKHTMITTPCGANKYGACAISHHFKLLKKEQADVLNRSRF